MPKTRANLSGLRMYVEIKSRMYTLPTVMTVAAMSTLLVGGTFVTNEYVARKKMSVNHRKRSSKSIFVRVALHRHKILEVERNEQDSSLTSTSEFSSTQMILLGSQELCAGMSDAKYTDTKKQLLLEGKAKRYHGKENQNARRKTHIIPHGGESASG